MSTKCSTCNEAITNSDFIKCEGVCAEQFHSKCVALNKTVLNSITSCPNIHWLCHECNKNRMTVATSIDNMRETIDNLTKSLSSDLLGGFKLLTDTLATTLAQAHRANVNHAADTSSTAKRRRELSPSASCSEDEAGARKKRFVTGSNINAQVQMVAVSTHNDNRKSVVISNIDKSITPEYISNYLSKELNIDEAAIRVTLLKPSRINEADTKFHQFRVSIPEAFYEGVRSPETWPIGVKIRDYVFHRRVGKYFVSKENFLSKRTPYVTTVHPSTAPFPSPTALEEAVGTENLIEIVDETV